MVHCVNVKEFRESLRRPAPCYRHVPAFSIQALQRNTRVLPLPKRDNYTFQAPKQSMFRRLYVGGDLPITIDSDGAGPALRWKVKIETLDFHHYLPIFFEGLTETVSPYKFLAEQGVHDLLTHGGHKVLPVVPQLIVPIKNALSTKHPAVMCTILKAIQHLVLSTDMAGEALVPYYRQILPIFNMFCNKNKNLWDGIDYSQQRRENLGDMVQETLELLERYGGEDAFINIKYMVAGKREPDQELEAQTWIEAVTGERFPPGVPYEHALRDGILLCKLINKLQPGIISKINLSGGDYKFMDNLSQFQRACTAYGVPDVDLFQTVDLWDFKNIAQVTMTIFAIGRTAYKHPEWRGPFLGPRPSEENRRDFSEEQLRAGETVIGLQAGTNRGANQSGQSFGATRKILLGK